MSGDAPKILVLGYGNPGRLDDGLGPALATLLETRALPGVTVQSDYQLVVEDAAPIAAHDVVIFADAHVSCAPPFTFARCQPRPAQSFSSHSVQPDALLAMARDLFGGHTRGYLLGIRGVAFNAFEERLSDEALANLDAAEAFIIGWIERGAPDDNLAAADPTRDREPITTEFARKPANGRHP